MNDETVPQFERLTYEQRVHLLHNMALEVVDSQDTNSAGHQFAKLAISVARDSCPFGNWD